MEIINLCFIYSRSMIHWTPVIPVVKPPLTLLEAGTYRKNGAGSWSDPSP